MSFDLYMQRFQTGQAAGISLDVVRDAFGKYVVELEEDFWQVQYSNAASSDIFLQPLPDHKELIHTLSIHRPCSDIRLWESLWLLLELPGTIFYYPGCVVTMARDSQAGINMPDDMRESLGDPAIATSALEIFQSINS